MSGWAGVAVAVVFTVCAVGAAYFLLAARHAATAQPGVVVVRGRTYRVTSVDENGEPTLTRTN